MTPNANESNWLLGARDPKCPEHADLPFTVFNCPACADLRWERDEAARGYAARFWRSVTLFALRRWNASDQTNWALIKEPPR